MKQTKMFTGTLPIFPGIPKVDERINAFLKKEEAELVSLSTSIDERRYLVIITYQKEE